GVDQAARIQRGDGCAPLADGEPRRHDHAPDDDGLKPPAPADPEHLVLAPCLHDEEHPLLGLAEQHLFGRHAVLAPRHAAEIDLHPQPAARGHLGCGAGESRGPHILDRDDGAGGQGLQARLDEELAGKRIPHLHRGSVAGIPRQFRGGERGPVDPVAAGRAPMARMSRMMPPTPVAAPWNGATALGWLWLSILKTAAHPSPTETAPAFSPGPWRTPRPATGRRRSAALECL